MKKISKIIICLMVLLSVSFMSVHNQSGLNKAYAGTKSESKKAIKAYKKYLKKGSVTINIEKESFECDFSKEKYCIHDINNDGTPELLLETEEEFGAHCEIILLTYYKGKVKPIRYYSHGGITCYEKGSVYLNGFMQMGNIRDSYCQLVKGKEKVVAYMDDTTQVMGYDGFVEYYIGDKKVSKAKYNKYIKKLTKGSKEHELDFAPIK